MKKTLSAIILTYNEELNLGQCLASIAGWADEIFVVDSFSTDKTLEIAKQYNATVVQHPFEGYYSGQYNWALEHLPIRSEWILRLDADEYLTEALKQEIDETLLRLAEDVHALSIKRRVYFMGRWIKHGGYYPAWFLRVFRFGKGRIEFTAMDEHTVLLEGTFQRLRNDFIHDNKKDLTAWTEKHNGYASREVQDLLSDYSAEVYNAIVMGRQVRRKRWLKTNVYLRLPMFWRAWFYFLYRYIYKLGFLDGKEGLIFHFLQGCWYRFLVDAKLYERRKIG